MNSSILSKLERIQIEQAAAGLISGTLSEWPILADALEKLQLPADPNLSYIRIRNLCKLIINSREW